MNRKWVVPVQVPKGGRIDAKTRQAIRAARDQQNTNFAALRRAERLGKFLRFVKSHAHGTVAEFAVELI